MRSEVRTKNLAEMFYDSARKYGNKPAFGTRNQLKQFDTINFLEVYETGLNLATGLIELGLKAREHVAVLSDNRKEWIITNYGIILSGCADVPRGTDVTDGDIRYILPHSDVRIVFVENETTLQKVKKNLGYLPNITHVILMDENSITKNKNLNLGEKIQSNDFPLNETNFIHMSELIAKGKRLRELGDKKVEERIVEIRPDDLFTIIYTSGTTGEPKGVMLTHANMISQLRNIPVKISSKDRFLSILPVWHSFERVFQMGTIAMGACQYYTSVRNIREDLSIVKPTFMASAPRLWENLYHAMQAKVDGSSFIKKNLFNVSYKVALQIHRSFHFFKGNLLDLNGRRFFQSLSLVIVSVFRVVVFLFPYIILDLIVLRKIRQVTGGKLRGTVSGGGSLPFHIDEFFNTIGIPVFEGYGLTETSPGLSFRSPNRLVIGSVGSLFPQTEIRIKNIETGEVVYPPKKGIKGEIYVRGPQIMKGYYKRPDVTAKVLSDDGWFNTGDLGIMTYNDTLKIVGRSKETIVLLNGENIEPVPIENKLIQSPLIDQVMVVGQDQKFLSALVLPNLGSFSEYGSTYEELAKNKVVQDKIEKEIKTIIRIENGFKSFEKIGGVRLLPKDFEVGDELSAKLSMKRHVISEKYQSLIESMYVEKVKVSVD